jgi:TRAP-type C4-dicarboxylate transport system permease small subunit
MSWLRKLYTLSGLLAGVFLIIICVLIVAQILARQFGTMIPSTDEFAGYSMAASGFLALPYALMRGAHIRVELLFRILPQRSLFAVEVLGNVVGLLIAAYLAWYCALFVLESYEFKEVSSGLLPIPMWIPQIPMVLGTVILVIAMVERLVLVCRGQRFEDQTPGVMSE